MIRKTMIGAWLVSSVLGASGTTAAQTPAEGAQRKLLARRAAEADCYRKLAESVHGIQINSETYVRDFMAESDEIRSAVDRFITGVRLGSPRYYDDGTCEVDAELSVSKLVTRLKEFHAAHYRGRSVKIVDIQTLEERVKTTLIRVTGSGAPRQDLPPELPEGTDAAITPNVLSIHDPRLEIPPIWKAVGGQARLLAQRAAQIDAMRKLLERIKGLRLTSDTLVRDFVAESDEIRARADGVVLGAAVVGKYLHHDELIAEVTMEVPIETVITRVKELHSEYYHGGKVTTTDITNIKKSVRRDMIRATGSGVPPSRYLRGAANEGVATPTWITERIRATGEATDRAFRSAQGRLRAHRAARVLAMRNLMERILGLPIRAGKTVGDFAGEQEEFRTQVDGVVTGAVEEMVEFVSDGVRVTMSLPGSEVWPVVHQHLLIVQRRR